MLDKTIYQIFSVRVRFLLLPLTSHCTLSPKKYNEFGKDDLVVVFGGLHIEMAFMSMIGDVSEASGWVDALIKSGLGNPGVVESFLSSSHVKHTRYAHEVTACTFHSLLRQGYQESDCDSSFDDFCDEQVKRHPQFRYWLSIMQLEVILLSFVRSLQQGNFELYLESLKKLAPWMFVLDHINYARWLPFYLRDMLLFETQTSRGMCSISGWRFCCSTK